MGEARSLERRSLEIIVSEPTAAAFAENPLLLGLGEIHHDLVGLGILDYGSYRNVQIDIFAVLAVAQGGTALFAVVGFHIFAVFEVDKCPELRVRPQDNMTSAAAVAAVRTALGNIFRPEQMGAAGASVAGLAMYLYKIYEIAFCHNVQR